jgi:hypothetical protein
VESVSLIFIVFSVVLLCVFTFWVPCCDVQIKTMFGSSLPPDVCRRTHVLFTLFAVSNTNCVVSFLFFLFFRLYHMLPVSLDCPLIFYFNCLCTARKTTIVGKDKSKTIETRLQIERKCSEVESPPPHLFHNYYFLFCF